MHIEICNVENNKNPSFRGGCSERSSDPLSRMRVVRAFTFGTHQAPEHLFLFFFDRERVVNLCTGLVLKDKKRVRRRWYMGVCVDGKHTYEHIFLYECFHEIDATGTQIDHIKGDHTDDRIQNLQRLTTRDHGRKTSATHGGETAKNSKDAWPIRNSSFESVAVLAKKIQNHAGKIMVKYGRSIRR